MPDFLRDPSLDEMVRRLNQGVATPDEEPAEIEPDAGAGLPASTNLTSESDPLVRLLRQVVRRGATDLLLVPGSPPVLRVGGRLVAADASPLDEDEVRSLFTPHLSARLLPRASGSGRIPAVEVLLANPAVRQHIRRERVQNLHQEVTLGKRQGMISLEESLADLVRRGLVALEEAQLRTAHQEELDALLRG